MQGGGAFLKSRRWEYEMAMVKTRAAGRNQHPTRMRLSGRSLAALAVGAIRKPEATAALEACAGVIGRAFAMAEIDAPPWAKEALSPSCLLLIGRSLIKAGEVLFKIDMTPNAVLRLYPVADHNVFGSHDPQQWTYRISLQGPSLISSAEQITSQSVLHFMYSTTASVPWRGQGPVQNAAAAGRLSAETVAALADELSGPRGFVLPLPGVDGGDTTIDGLKSDIKTLSGQVATVESMSSGWNEGDKRTSPQGDWEVKRIGARPPEALIQLQSVATMEILSACGLSPAPCLMPKPLPRPGRHGVNCFLVWWLPSGSWSVKNSHASWRLLSLSDGKS